MLGGLANMRGPISAAHSEGYRVVTCDWNSANPAHSLSDDFRVASITDYESVLKIAEEIKPDGILSPGVDPGVVVAAKVAERLGLPVPGPIESIEIMQNKMLFRDFLEKNGFRVPARAIPGHREISSLKFPVIIKPVDSAGSKGVTMIRDNVGYESDGYSRLDRAVEYAASKSPSGQVIIEEFVDSIFPQSDSDWLVVDGKIVCATFSSMGFDMKSPNPFAPAWYSWPSSIPEYLQMKCVEQVQRLVSMLKLRTTMMNVELRIDNDGMPVIMECSPRNGGSRLAEMVALSTGVDMLKGAVRAAVGEDPGVFHHPLHYDPVGLNILHCDHDAIFKGIHINTHFAAEVVEEECYVAPGMMVGAFRGASDGFGHTVFRFPDTESLKKAALSINTDNPIVSIITE